MKLFKFYLDLYPDSDIRLILSLHPDPDIIWISKNLNIRLVDLISEFLIQFFVNFSVRFHGFSNSWICLTSLS